MVGSAFRWIIVLLTCIVLTSFFHQGNRINGVIWSDQEGYYIYLPALFIDGFDKAECINGCYQVQTAAGSRLFTKYTYGVALLESPFFLGAHVFAKLTDHKADGRSLPYIWSVMLAAIFYLLAGLYLISKLLKELGYSTTTGILIPVGLLFGTNLFYYTFRESGMSHVYSFFLVAALIFASHRNSISSNSLWGYLTAVILALIILIRPTNAILGLIPVLWNAGLTDARSRVSDFLSNGKWWLTFVLAIAVFFAPQMAYWKSVTGSYVFYSYGEEGFTNWMSPKVLQVLFSHTNGWLIYSPILLAAFLGMALMIYRKQRGWLLSILVLTLATYVFGSWWAWWFGGAYGHRCYVEYLPLLAVPAAVAFNWIMKRNNLVRAGFLILAILAIYVNLRMSFIYEGMWDGPTWNWGSYIGKLKVVFYVD